MPKEWLAAEDWSIYHFKVLQGETLAYPLEEVVDTVRRWVSGKTKTQLLEQSLLEGVPMAPVSTTEELVRFLQLEERGYWIQAPLPNGQELPTPGLLARLTETPLKVRRWPPTKRYWAACSASPPPRPPPPADRRVVKDL